MNEESSETPLSFLIDPESIAKQIRADLKANKDLVMRAQATNKSKLVALVEIDWYRDLMRWIVAQDEDLPGQIPNHKLCKDGKLETSLKLGKDFVAVSPEGWDVLVRNFKGGPKILRNFVLNPKNKKPCILTDPVQIEIIYNGKTYRKHVDRKWNVGPIKKLLCKTLEIEPNDYAFFDSKKETELDKESDVATIMGELPGPWNLMLTEAAMNKPPSGIDISSHEAANMHLFDAEVAFSFLSIPLYSFFYINRLRDLIFNPDLQSMISKVSTSNNVGKATAIIRKMFRELIQEGDEKINTDIYFTFLFRTYEEFQNDDTRSITQSITAILSLLHNDTIREDSTSPISDIFTGMFHSTLECESCHEFTDLTEDFDIISVPIPTSLDDVSLEDCIANFSLPEEMPLIERRKCQKCGKAAPLMRYRTIKKIGDVLIINIKRFLVGGIFEKKVSTYVKFPFVLKSASFASETNDTLVLKSVIFHKGELESTEYAVAVNTKDGWIYISTSGACKIDSSELLNPEALVLFYEKA